MRTKLYTIAFVLLCMLAATLVAATREWSVPADGQLYQIVADGKGGFAFISIGTTGVAKVSWLDKKGAVKYQDTIGSIGPYSGLIKCSKKELVYSSAVPPQFRVVQVDKHGQMTEVTDPGKLLLGPNYPYAATQPSDTKGFFVIAADTNAAPTSFELVRFSSK